MAIINFHRIGLHIGLGCFFVAYRSWPPFAGTSPASLNNRLSALNRLRILETEQW